MPPWKTSRAENILFFPFISEATGPADSPVGDKKRKAMATLQNQVKEYGPLQEVWTDGACESGLGRGVAAYIVHLTVRLADGVHVTKEVVRDQVGVSNICDAYHDAPSWLGHDCRDLPRWVPLRGVWEFHFMGMTIFSMKEMVKYCKFGC